MAMNPHRWVSPQTYLQIERTAETKSEYINGEMYARAGASEAHNAISANIVAALLPQIRTRGCRLYANDMRVKVPATTLYTYPDIVIVCGTRRFEDTFQDTLTNPVIVMEILSPSTERYDRGEKFAHYRRLPTLQEYILIAQDKTQVEHYVRQAEGSWNLRVLEMPKDTLPFVTIEATLSLSTLYDQVFDDDSQ